MTMHTLALVIFLVCGSVALIYEIVALLNKREGDTWSEYIQAMALKRPLVPFVFGLRCGHWFWSLCP